VKQNGKYLGISALVMLLIPVLVTRSIQSDGAFMVILLLFFVLNPFVSLLMGLEAGKAVRQSWYLPLANAAFFLVGVWLNFEMGEPAFFYYVGFYLLVGYAAMLLRWIFRTVK